MARATLRGLTELANALNPEKKGSMANAFEKNLLAAINNSAFHARGETPKYINRHISAPTPFTLRPPYVHKAKPSSMIANVQSLDKQDGYLSVLELGLTIRNVQTPVRGTEDRYGNLRAKFTRKNIDATLRETMQINKKPRTGGMKFGSGSGTKGRKAAQQSMGNREVGKYFIGRKSQGGKPGLWMRMAKNKGVKMVFSFERTRKYKKQLNLRGFWADEAGKKMSEEMEKDWMK